MKAFAFNKNLHFISTKYSVPHAEASWPVLDFQYYSLHPKLNQTLNCLIEHLEEEEYEGKLQNSISIGSKKMSHPTNPPQFGQHLE